MGIFSIQSKKAFPKSMALTDFVNVCMQLTGDQIGLDQSLHVYKAPCHQSIKLTDLELKYHSINNCFLLSVVEVIYQPLKD